MNVLESRQVLVSNQADVVWFVVHLNQTKCTFCLEKLEATLKVHMLYCSITQLKQPPLKVGEAWRHRERQDVIMIVQMWRTEHFSDSASYRTFIVLHWNARQKFKLQLLSHSSTVTVNSKCWIVSGYTNCQALKSRYHWTFLWKNPHQTQINVSSLKTGLEVCSNQ